MGIRPPVSLRLCLESLEIPMAQKYRLNFLLKQNFFEQYFGFDMINNPLLLKCSTSEHENEHASFYCLEQQCQSKRIYCALCLSEAHKDHANRPIKFFLHEIYRDAEILEGSILSFSKIDLLKDKILMQCSKIEDNHLRDLVISSANQYFDKIMSSCLNKRVCELLSILSNNPREKLDRFLELFETYCLDWQKNHDQIQTNEPNFHKFLKALVANLTEKLTDLTESMKKGNLDINLAEIFLGENSSKRFGFSPKMMNSGLKFIDSTKVSISNYADYNYFALCEPQLSVNKIQQISFKMINLNSYVTCGICKKNKVESQYEFMSNGLGHGSYQVSYDGYTWSDTDSSINEQYAGWYYNQGDTVTVEFNPKTKKIKFTKNAESSSPSSYEMPFEYEKSDKLHFCVSLNSEPEEVQIV